MGPKRSKGTTPFSLLQNMIYAGFENFGKYYSSYRGIVANNKDPFGLQRVQLIIPQVTGDDIHETWAFPKSVWYGKGYGTQLVPQEGDVVWVEFEGGNPEVPIWTHGHPSIPELPSDKDLLDPNCYWMITPKGNKVIINDTKNTIHIEHSKGQYVEINDKSVSLVSSKAISSGKLNKSDYSAVLGEKLEEVLNDMEKFINEVYKALDLDVKAAAPFIQPTKLKVALPPLKNLVDNLKSKIKPILSKLNSLD